MKLDKKSGNFKSDFPAFCGALQNGAFIPLKKL
jgi:hypothetical protein